MKLISLVQHWPTENKSVPIAVNPESVAVVAPARHLPGENIDRNETMIFLINGQKIPCQGRATDVVCRLLGIEP